jgi:hypothetical protein
MRLKKHGAAQLRLHGEHSRVEAFKMAGLQDALVFYGQVEHFVSLRERGGNGLLDKQVETGSKQH